jgi:hypothetical protein
VALLISRFGVSVLIAASLLPCSLAGVYPLPFIDLKLTAVAREYCHIVRFTRGWKLRNVEYLGQPVYIDYSYSDYEFRVEGILGTWFLVGAFEPRSQRRFYATNEYRINLSDPTATALPANDKDWKAATVIPLVRKSLFTNFGVRAPDHAELNGFQYKKTGDSWSIPESASRLSPDGSWLVLQSFTETKPSSRLPVSNVFFDVFNAATGKKLVTIQGTYSGIGNDETGCLGRSAWVTERYFIIPLGPRRERCVVCEFPARVQQGEKP